MPTYSYICKNCNQEIEIFHSIKASPAKICSKCGAEALVKQISEGSYVSFKGTGFYETDYKKKSESSSKN